MKAQNIPDEIRRIRYQGAPALRERMKRQLDAQWSQHVPSQVSFVHPWFGRLALGGVVVLLVVAGLSLLNHAMPAAHALEQSWEAMKDIRTFHFQFIHPGAKQSQREAWIEYDAKGEPNFVRVNFYDFNNVTIWSRGVTQCWYWETGEWIRFEDMEYSEKILMFAHRHNPKHALEYLRRMEEQGKVQITAPSPAERTPLRVTVLYEPNTYLVGTPKPAMREVLRIDPNTRFVMDIEVATLQEGGGYTSAGTWEYLDYNIPFDAGTFNLENEVSPGVTCFNTADTDLGCDQGGMFDEAVAQHTVKMFLQAWVAQDYEEALRIHGYRRPGESEAILGQMKKTDIAGFAAAGKILSAPVPRSGYTVFWPVQIATARGERTIEFEFHVNRMTPTRWRIRRFSHKL